MSPQILSTPPRKNKYISNHQSTGKWLQELSLDKAPLNDQQRNDLQSLILRYHDVFSKSDEDLGETHLMQHRIETGNAAPISQPPRRLAPHKRAIVREMIDQMLTNGVIEESSSPWSSPIVLVAKPDGSARMCIDYRKLNAVTKKCAFPLVRCDDALEALANTKYFSTMDMNSGYLQIPVHPEDIEKTSFSTPWGLYQYRRMPFGLVGAPATFQRLVNVVLRGLNFETCMAYLDDILVHGSTFEEHLQRLEQVLKRLRTANLKLKPRKCEFGRKECKFLGFIVNEHGIKVDELKVAPVKSWPRPTNVKEVQQFVGLATYYRKFIKNFAAICRPLHLLTRKDQPFEWSDQAENAFITLKRLLTSTDILAYPHFGPNAGPYVLDTDASNIQVGAVLSQLQNGQERVIAYASRCLTKSELNYCTTHKELLALITHLRKFRHYLLPAKFTIRTDHFSLKWIQSIKNPSGQLARWIEELSAFDYEIEHRPGLKHGNADSLSRRPTKDHQGCPTCDPKNTPPYEEIEPYPKEETLNEVSVNIVPNTLSLENIKREQYKDEDLRWIIDYLADEIKPTETETIDEQSRRTSLIKVFDSLLLRECVLQRKTKDLEGKDLIVPVIPAKLVPVVLKSLHDNPGMGHWSDKKMIDLVRKRYWWPKYTSDIHDWVKSCTTCSQCQPNRKATRAPLIPIQPTRPFEKVAMDIMGPIRCPTTHFRYILVITDMFTRWAEAVLLVDIEAKTVAQAVLDQWITRFGCPKVFHSDQGSNFMSELMTIFCQLLNIEQSRTTPYHPQGNGAVERINRTIKEVIRKYVDEDEPNWTEKLQLAMMAYRSSMHSATQMSPFKLLFGNEMRLPTDEFISQELIGQSDTIPQYVERLQTRLIELYEIANKRNDHSKLQMKEHHDKKSTKPQYKKGDLVWLNKPVPDAARAAKFSRPYEGPYMILEKLSPVTFKIKIMKIGSRKRPLTLLLPTWPQRPSGD